MPDVAKVIVRLTVWAVACMVFAAVPTRAAKPTTVVVLLEVDSAQGLERASLMSTALKAARASDDLKWRAPPQVSLEEAGVMLGCTAWTPPCLRRVGQMMRARRVVYMLARGTDDERQITVRVVQAKGATPLVDRTIAVPTGMDGSAVARAVLTRALSGELPTIVRVRAPADGVLTWDGQKMGAPPHVLLDAVPPGPATFQWEGSGDRKAQSEVMVVPGVPLDVELAPVEVAAPPVVATAPADVPAAEPDATPTPAPAIPGASAAAPNWSAIGGWAALGTGAILGATGAGLYAMSLNASAQIQGLPDAGLSQQDALPVYEDLRAQQSATYLGAAVSGGVAVVMGVTGVALIATSGGSAE